MKEAEWLRCEDPNKMLTFLKGKNARVRRARLFAAACCRRAWPDLGDGRSQAAIEALERFADGPGKQPDKNELKAAWKAAIAATVSKFGALHVLLNSAGIGLTKTVEDIELEEWRKVHAIDLDGVFLGCKHGVSEIKKHTGQQAGRRLGGSIINISSISGIIAGANMAAYNSAKAGVRLLSKSVALHCAKSGYNIRCNSVHPTFIDTPILDRYRDRFGNEVMQQKLGRQVPIGRLGRPEEVGWALVFLASDESSFMTGSEVVIDGGISAM